jgi:hypothetical protein
MTIEEFASEVDDLYIRLSCGITALHAIHDCLANGPCEPDSYIEGLYGVYDYLKTIADELGEKAGSVYLGQK